jgi:hypothetical protein
MDADEAALLLEAYDAVDLGILHGSDLEVAQAAFRALKP